LKDRSAAAESDAGGCGRAPGEAAGLVVALRGTDRRAGRARVGSRHYIRGRREVAATPRCAAQRSPSRRVPISASGRSGAALRHPHLPQPLGPWPHRRSRPPQLASTCSPPSRSEGGPWPSCGCGSSPAAAPRATPWPSSEAAAGSRLLVLDDGQGPRWRPDSGIALAGGPESWSPSFPEASSSVSSPGLRPAPTPAATPATKRLHPCDAGVPPGSLLCILTRPAPVLAGGAPCGGRCPSCRGGRRRRHRPGCPADSATGSKSVSW
jgi:hypothetical protein